MISARVRWHGEAVARDQAMPGDGLEFGRRRSSFVAAQLLSPGFTVGGETDDPLLNAEGPVTWCRNGESCPHCLSGP